jgi:hypothetical protein
MIRSPSPLLISSIYAFKVRSINEIQIADPPGARFAFSDGLSPTPTSKTVSARTTDVNAYPPVPNRLSLRFISPFARFLLQSSDSRHFHDFLRDPATPISTFMKPAQNLSNFLYLQICSIRSISSATFKRPCVQPSSTLSDPYRGLSTFHFGLFA